MTDDIPDRSLYFVRVSHRGSLIMGGHWLAADEAEARALGRDRYLSHFKGHNYPALDQCTISAAISHAHPRNALNKETE